MDAKKYLEMKDTLNKFISEFGVIPFIRACASVLCNHDKKISQKLFRIAEKSNILSSISDKEV